VPDANNSGHNVPLSKEEEFRRDPVDDTWEWWLYKLRQRLEIKDLSSQLQSTPQHPVNIPFGTGIIQPPRSTNFPVMTQNGLLENNNNANNDSSKTFTINSNNMVNLRTPFGFRIHRCYICLDISLNAVFYPVNEEGTAEQIAMHMCKTGDLARSRNLLCKNKLRDTSNKMLKFLENKLYASPLKNYKYLVAVPLKVNSLPEGLEGIILKMPNPENPKIPMSFSYSDERHIELDMSKDFHAGIDRAISRNGCTELSKEEILEFLELVGTATFVFIKVKQRDL
jgi:hypothetical protein